MSKFYQFNLPISGIRESIDVKNSVGEYNEQSYANKFGYLIEIKNFLKRHKLLSVKKKQLTLFSSTSKEEIEFAVKKSSNKKKKTIPGLDSTCFTKHLRKKQYHVYINSSRKLKRRKHFLISFMKPELP